MTNPLDCDVDNDDRTCPTCGWKARARHVRRNCPPKLAVYLNRRPAWWAWGTWLAIWLKAWGISKESIESFNARLSIEVKTCGCVKRELLLNRLGLRFAQAITWRTAVNS